MQRPRMSTGNKRWLMAIVAVLLGIFAVLVIEVTRKEPGDRMSESIRDIVESAGDGGREFREEVIDEIDDNTD